MSPEKKRITLIIPNITLTPPPATPTSSVSPTSSTATTSPTTNSPISAGTTSTSTTTVPPTMNGLEAMFLHLTCTAGEVFCLGMVHAASRRAEARQRKEAGVDATERVIPGVRRSRVREE